MENEKEIRKYLTKVDIWMARIKHLIQAFKLASVL